MPANYPASLDSLTNPAGTQTLDNPDHAGQHSNANDILEAIESTLGTNSGTSVLKHFTAGQFPIRATGVATTGTLVQTIVGGTHNNFTGGTPHFTGGTHNSFVAGTPTIAGTWVAPAGLVVSADIKDANITTVKILDSNVTTAKIADANVTGRKMKIDQRLGSSVAAGTTASTSYVDLIAGTFTPNVTSSILVLANSADVNGANDSTISYVITFNGTIQGNDPLWRTQQNGAEANREHSGAGFAWVPSAPASAGTVKLRYKVSAGTASIISASFQALPFAA